MLLGNKNDLKEARVVDRKLVETYARHHKLPYWEVSAHTGESIEEAFTEFARKIVTKKMADRVRLCSYVCSDCYGVFVECSDVLEVFG